MLYKTFTIQGKYYVYDVASNDILVVSRRISNYLDGQISFNELTKKEKNIIKTFKQNGYFKIKPFNKFRFNFLDNFDNYFKLTKTNIKKLTIVINEKCNFNCRYCLYGGNYRYRKRLSGLEINMKTAEKAIDFYFKNSTNIQQKNITFYGGEPLISKEKLFKIINYARSKYNYDKLKINLTTNGSLLNQGFLDFFSKNKIYINISLDGPRQIHDKFRIQKTGDRTHNLIINKLQLIKNYNEDYFNNFVSISVTVNPPYRFDLLEKYFRENNLLRFLKLDMSYVEDKDASWLKSVISANALYKLKAKREIQIIKECTKRFMANKTISNLYKNIFLTRLKNIQYRDKTKLKDFLDIKGPCFPSLSMLLLGINGNFYICTMLDNEYRIGNVKTGLDAQKIKRSISNIYNFIKSNCGNCWLARLCHPCLAKFNRSELLPKRKNLCFYRKAVFSELLKSYVKIKDNERVKL